MEGPLLDIIDRLDEVDDSDQYASKCIFVEAGGELIPAARARVCPGGDGVEFGLRYVLMVQQAQDVIEVWSLWRNGAVPSPQDKFEAVMYYYGRDAYLPVEDGPQ